MPTKILLGSDAQAVLRNLPPVTKKKMRAALQVLKDTWPKPSGLDLKQMRSDPRERPVFRLRVGSWRVVFRAQARALEVVRVLHRRDGYDWFEED